VLQDSGEALVWCEEGCGNNMHKKCFDVWAATKRSNAATITCVYCRAPWKGAAPGGYCCRSMGQVVCVVWWIWQSFVLDKSCLACGSASVK
jgi:hypothetical protein